MKPITRILIIVLSLLLFSCSKEDSDFKRILDAAWDFKVVDGDGLDTTLLTALEIYLEKENYNPEQLKELVSKTFNQKYSFKKAKQMAQDHCHKVKANYAYKQEAIDARVEKSFALRETTLDKMGYDNLLYNRSPLYQIMGNSPVVDEKYLKYGFQNMDKQQLFQEAIQDYIENRIILSGEVAYCPYKDVPVN